ncbi:hypothetical protein A1F94_013422 [Pyrenophora tritici-repentis]|uniref:Uncharacterized protein n=2 Tax=Pyrenophora tritici-repentis TaxID=45151 RepID=A0A5M9LC01_9PLEO|nr:uncharacterized protein PTRG_10326 [Pyrenophora tritici-repentis Pt-1C-BFP]KAA8620940.1 hypothetical protein PtrV1_05441 [Pyrenophora tritici-repentis]EDU43377.1 predicted protein [Pyrenophora tritici-repentis Pt-1C-BFP]KAF7450184.1 hypothetical protein A1F99_048000 [Pyrenophora tritici-repentis]KAF7572756.1 hypothetical protein PtrM4_076610 [Pyrenophora tritici-repentis]KAG9376156.1 hypothetical protein A1F94_013422 [Pyrenophora tritici-repentis]
MQRSPPLLTPLHMQLLVISVPNQQNNVFMASIVLVTNVCVNPPAFVQCELLNGDVAEALKIPKDARSDSLTTAKLFE